MRAAPALLSLLLIACPVDDGGLTDETPPPTTSPEDVSLTTSDGLTLRGTWQAARGADRGPGVLLLHQFGPYDLPGQEQHDRSDFDPVFDAFVEAGVSVLALDFRSHGRSDPAVNLGSSLELLSDREQLPLDVQAGLWWLRTERNFEVGDEQIGVLGLSVGGNLALTTANRADEWGSYAQASVSARRDRAEDFDPQGDDTLTIENTLLVSAEDEQPQATHAQEMYDRALDLGTGSNELLLRPGSAHGAALLADDRVVQEAVVDWFASRWAE